MWLTYLIEIVVQHTNLRSRGYVYLFDTSHGAGTHYNRKSTQYMCRALDDIFPIRRCSIHVCNASPLVNYVIFPVVQRLTPKKIRLRTRLHRGSGADLLRSLAEFNLPRDRLASDMGGSVVMDINQFLIDRFSLEASRAGINLQAPETVNVDQAGRTGTPLPSAAQHHNEYGQALPIDGPPAGGEATAATRTHNDAEDNNSKRKRTQNVGDPRMAKAVQAKQEEPNLSLYDALTSGGYAFPQKSPGQTDNDVFDADGVSLKQRKNNLCTRLKRTQAKDEAKRASEPIGNDGTTFVNQCQASAGMSRRDSFDEEIEGLPGLDGLEDGDLDIASLNFLDGDKKSNDLIQHT